MQIKLVESMLKRLKKLFGIGANNHLNVVVYRSYGTDFHLYIKGRVLDNLEINFRQKSNFFITLATTIKQFNTHEIPNVPLKISIGSIDLSQKSDQKGYFLFDEVLPIDISTLADDEGWVSFQITAETPKLGVKSFQGRF